MKIEFKNWNIILVIIIVVLLVLLIETCRRNANYSSDVAELVDYKDTVKHYKDLNGELVSFNDAVEINFKSFIAMNAELEKELKNLKLKKPSSVTYIRSEVRIDTMPIPFKDTLPCDDFNKFFPIDSQYYKMDVTLNKKALLLSRIAIPDSLQIIKAKKKNGLFKRNERIITITHSNPFIHTLGLQSYTIKKEANRFNFGPSLSYGFSLQDLEPKLVIGVSAQYNLFGF